MDIFPTPNPPSSSFSQQLLWNFQSSLKNLKFQIPFPPSVGSFIIKSQGQEEVKNLEDLLSKFNIRLVKTLLLSQSWESFQT